MGERILVVDDEEVNRELLDAILAEAGYDVTLAADGRNAMMQVLAAQPDLVLLDLLMPGMDGLEVCRRLKAAPNTSAVPIIVVTAVGDVAAKEAALTGGADDFVTKPIQPDDLRARVRAMLRVRTIRPELDRTLAYLHELEAVQRAGRGAAPNGNGVGAASEGPATIPVLIVDDEALTRNFYGDLLAEHGFQVYKASSGPEGLQLASQHRVETILLDIVMPGMSGLEVLEALRGRDPHLPVIMLTAHPSSRNAIAALKLGAADFIAKGLDHDLVILAVHRAVRQRRERVQRAAEVERLQGKVRELETQQALQRA
jgi:two-component system cell cycle response regulator